MERGTSYEELKNACYWNQLRIYTAEGALLTSATKLPLPANSIIGGLGLAATGDDTVAVGVGPAGSFVTGLIVVPAGDIVETSFDLNLPETVVDWMDDISTYTLKLVAQPGTLGRATHVQVELPPGQMIARGSTSPSGVNGRLISFDLPLTEDTVITLAMQPVESASSSSLPISGVPITGLRP
jgi:hypothetical protein